MNAYPAISIYQNSFYEIDNTHELIIEMNLLMLLKLPQNNMMEPVLHLQFNIQSRKL